MGDEEKVCQLLDVDIPLMVLVDHRLGNAAKLLYAALLYFSGSTGVCRPPLPRLIRFVGLHRQTVRKGLSQLEKSGLIVMNRLQPKVTEYTLIGGLERAYCDKDGFLTDDSIKRLLDAGEWVFVERLNLDRIRRRGEGEDVPGPYPILRRSADNMFCDYVPEGRSTQHVSGIAI